MTAHTVTFQPSGVRLDCDGDETILDTALAAGFFLKHSCRRGECHSCEARIVSGNVRYAGRAAVDSVRPGHCLTCVAHPVGDVVIDAPEVSSVPGQRIVTSGARVTSVERISHDVTIVRLQVPKTAGFNFTPGQYVDVILRDGSRRSYSMGNRPDGEGNLELHVRAIPDGRFSQHAYRNLKPRDLLRIEGPFGSFRLSESEAPIILLASGTGYAPIASFMRSHHRTLAERGAVFYWGGQRHEDLYAIADILAWERQRGGFKFVPVLSNPGEDWAGRRGLVHKAVQEDIPDLSGFEVYACGNPLMVDAARTSFVADHGLAPEHFFSDSFVTGPASAGLVELTCAS